MKPCVIHIDFVILFILTYGAHMFPVENEVINKVYHELRDIVKLATKSPDTNLTQSKAESNLTHPDAIDAIDVTGANTTTSRQHNENLKEKNVENSPKNEFFNLTNLSDGSFRNNSIQKSSMYSTSGKSTAPGSVFNNSNPRIKRTIEPILLTNEIRAIEAGLLVTKRESGIDGKLTDEIEDILPLQKRSKDEMLSGRVGRDKGQENRVKDKRNIQVENILPKKNWVLSKRESEDERKQEGELTNEIEDIIQGSAHAQHDKHEKIYTADNHGVKLKRDIRAAGSKREPTFNVSSQESEEELPSNHMYHAEHGHHYVRHHSGNMHNDHRENDGHHNNNEEEEEEDHNGREWHNYHHRKFHHVKFKLHGEGKTPSEWAKQEAKEMGDQGVIYDQGTYHAIDNLPDTLAAGFFHLICEDCLASS